MRTAVNENGGRSWRRTDAGCAGVRGTKKPPRGWRLSGEGRGATVTRCSRCRASSRYTSHGQAHPQTRAEGKVLLSPNGYTIFSPSTLISLPFYPHLIEIEGFIQNSALQNNR
jgi:hypothetical protein